MLHMAAGCCGFGTWMYQRHFRRQIIFERDTQWWGSTSLSAYRLEPKDTEWYDGWMHCWFPLPFRKECVAKKLGEGIHGSSIFWGKGSGPMEICCCPHVPHLRCFEEVPGLKILSPTLLYTCFFVLKVCLKLQALHVGSFPWDTPSKTSWNDGSHVFPIHN